MKVLSTSVCVGGEEPGVRQRGERSRSLTRGERWEYKGQVTKKYEERRGLTGHFSPLAGMAGEDLGLAGEGAPYLGLAGEGALYLGLGALFSGLSLHKILKNEVKLQNASLCVLPALLLLEAFCYSLLPAGLGLSVFFVACVFYYIALPVRRMLPAAGRSVLVTGKSPPRGGNRVRPARCGFFLGGRGDLKGRCAQIASFIRKKE